VCSRQLDRFNESLLPQFFFKVKSILFIPIKYHHPCLISEATHPLIVLYIGQGGGGLFCEPERENTRQLSLHSMISTVCVASFSFMNNTPSLLDKKYRIYASLSSYSELATEWDLHFPSSLTFK
jgi:hypothetical protein